LVDNVAGEDGVQEAGMTARKVEQQPPYYHQPDDESGTTTAVIAGLRVVRLRACHLDNEGQVVVVADRRPA
jgi:hypothetical protein